MSGAGSSFDSKVATCRQIALWIPLGTIVCVFLAQAIPGVGLLNHRIIYLSILVYTAKLLFKVVVQMYIPTSILWVYPFSNLCQRSILTNVFIFANMIGIYTYFTLHTANCPGRSRPWGCSHYSIPVPGKSQDTALEASFQKPNSRGSGAFTSCFCLSVFLSPKDLWIRRSLFIFMISQGLGGGED